MEYLYVDQIKFIWLSRLPNCSFNKTDIPTDV